LLFGRFGCVCLWDSPSEIELFRDGLDKSRIGASTISKYTAGKIRLSKDTKSMSNITFLDPIQSPDGKLTNQRKLTIKQINAKERED